MEEPLDKVLAGLLLKSNTTGAMVVDKNGLCLALKGTASEKAAGYAKLLAERAKQLGDGGRSVCIETDSGSILLEENGGNVIVLYRSAAPEK